MAKKCELCNRNNAVVRYRFYLDFELIQLDLCPICASKIDSFGGKLTSDDIENYFQINERNVEQKKCSVCRTTEEDVCQGYLGCDNCYKTFEDVVEKYIKTNCNGESYKGKSPLAKALEPKTVVEKKQPKKIEKVEPPKEPTIDEMIAQLTKEKEKAVASEDYSLAKELKIKIDKLKEKK